MIRIIFRTCDKVESLHGLQRPFGDKKEIIKACYSSLIKSMKGMDYKMYIVADDVSDEILDFLTKESPEKVINKKMGNDGSLRECFNLAKTFDDKDLVYFVEDDYLHTPIFQVCFKDFERYQFDLLIHPTDYPDQYTREDLIIRSYVLLGSFFHYREVSSTTFTFITKVEILKKHFEHFIASCEGANDAKLSEIRKKNVLILSPLPGVATHLHIGTMGLYVNWEEVFKWAKSE